MKIGYFNSKKNLVTTFLFVFAMGWLLYFVAFLIVHHFYPHLDLDFMLHDNYIDYTDRFRDFFEVNRAAAEGNCYLTGACSNYPPLALVIAKFLSYFTPNVLSDETALATRDSFNGIVLFWVFFGTIFIACFRMLQQYFQRHLDKTEFGNEVFNLLALLMVCSYSMIYGLERGNYILLAVVSFLVFAFTYERNEVFSAVALAICACIKVYPVVLITLFLIDKKYKGFLVGMLTGLAGLFLPMLFLEGSITEQFWGMVNGVLSFNANSMATHGEVSFAYVEQHSNSFSNIFRVFALFVSEKHIMGENGEQIIDLLSMLSSVCTVVLVIASVVAIVRTKVFWKRLCILTCLLHLLPSNTYDYMLAFFLPIIAIAICEGKEEDRKFVVILTLLACVPKSLYFLPFGIGDVSIQCVINPLLMTLIIIELFAQSTGVLVTANEEQCLEAKKYDFDPAITNMCKAVAISLIVYFQCISFVDTSQFKIVLPYFKKIFGDTSFIWVSCFVFLSAYGYTKVTQSNEIFHDPVRDYLKLTLRRLGKLYSQYWFVFLLALICGLVLSPDWMNAYVAYGKDGLLHQMLRIAFNFFGLTHLFYGDNAYTLNQTWWYMSLAILLILLIPMIIYAYRHVKLETIAAALLISLTVGDVKYLQYILIAVLGVVCSSEQVFERINWLCTHSLGAKIVGPLFWFTNVIIWYYFRQYKASPIQTAIDAEFVIASFSFIHCFVSKIPLFSKALSFIGKYSANIFMIHSFVYLLCRYTFQASYMSQYDLLIWAAVMAVSLFVSVVLEWCKKKLGWNQLVLKIFWSGNE